jgi:hypothetical protein
MRGGLPALEAGLVQLGIAWKAEEKKRTAGYLKKAIDAVCSSLAKNKK